MRPSLEGTKAAGGSLGRRPPPPPPSSTDTAPIDEESFIPVDNLAHSFVEAYFHEADADGDGRVADEEARNFFLRTGLSPADLSTIWKVVKPPTAVALQGKGLTKRRFSQALRLIALAQQGNPLTPELATAALSPETWLQKGFDPLPTPMINPLPLHPPPAASSLKAFLPGQQHALLGSDIDEDDLPLVDVDMTGSTTNFVPPQKQQQEQQQGQKKKEIIFQQQDGPVAASQQQPETAEEAIITGLEFLGIEQPVVGSTSIAKEKKYMQQEKGEDLLGLGTLQEEEGQQEIKIGDSILSSEKIQEEHQQLRPVSGGRTATRPPSLASLGNRSLVRASVLQSHARGSRNFVSTSLEAPLAYELRYPPLNPKESAKLGVLIASNGSLFAGPSVENGLLQWSMPEGEVREGGRPGIGGSGKKKFLGRLASDLRATHESKHPVPTEDADAAFCSEIPASPRSRPVTCLFTDESRGVLYVGDKDGYVAAYDISGLPGTVMTPESAKLYFWQAHRIGTISAMCLSSTGELWTGSSRGTIRIWRVHGPGSGTGSHIGAVGKPRELRRPAGERAHSGPIVSMVCSADGQIVWTASRSSVVLWDAYSGAYLGSLSRENLNSTTPGSTNTSTMTNSTTNISSGGGGIQLDPLGSGGAGAGPGYGTTTSAMYGTSSYSTNSSTGSYTHQQQQQQQLYMDGRINASTGLDIDPSHGAVLIRPSISDRERLVLQQESWAAQSERGVAEFAERFSEGAGRAVKLIGKLGAKLGVISSGGGGGGSSSGGGGAAGGSPNSGANSSTHYQDSQNTQEGGDVPPEQQNNTLSGGDIIALVASLENEIWVGYRRGCVERYTAAGKLNFARKFGGKIHTMAPVGRKLWIGFTNGMLSVLGPDGTGLKAFLAHKAGIVAIAPAGSRTFTLAADGSINGWSSAIPCHADEDALDAWHKQASSTYVRESINVLAVTWNCGESRPESTSPVFRWLHEHGFDKSLVVIGLQEVEMGGTSVALAAAKNALASRLQEKGNANAQFWSMAILNALGGDRHWHQVGLRQLSGMLIVAFARNNLRGHIGEIATASVACGVLGVGGNKGAVAVEFTLHRQKFAVVCSHFAAHQNAVKARNSNYAVIAKHLTFNRRAWLGPDDDDYYSVIGGGDGQSQIVQSGRKHVRSTSSSSNKEVIIPDITISTTSTGNIINLDGGEEVLLTNSSAQSSDDEEQLDTLDNTLTDTAVTTMTNTVTTPIETTITTTNQTPNTASIAVSTTTSATTAAVGDVSNDQMLQGEGLRGADALIWLGDFNYRIDGQYDQVKELAISGEFGPLLACDQLRREMVAGNVFRGLREGNINFPPTYKFDKGVPSPAAYDSSEKRRVPAWCDRIFFRGSTPFNTPFSTSSSSLIPSPNKISTATGTAPEDYFLSGGDVVDSTPLPREQSNRDMYTSTKDRIINNNSTVILNDDEYESIFSAAGPEEICVRPREYGCWGDVYDSDHRPVYASLEISLPVTDASKKRDLISDLVKKYAPPELILGLDSEPEVTLAPGTVKVHPIHMPDQMVLLSNNGVANVTFTVLIAGDDGGNSTGFTSGLNHFGTGASSQIEIRPMVGFVRAGSDAEIRIRASPGGAGSYASTPREVNVRILLATEYSNSGAVVRGEGRGEVEFTAVVLPEFALDDSF